MTRAKIFEIKRFAVHDGDGIRTTLFLKGCPLRCIWCHNPEGLSSKPELAYYAHKCVGCGECVTACPQGAHRMTETGHHFDRAACIGCGACAERCLGEALRLYGREMTVEEVLPMLLEDKEFYEASGGGVTLSGGECLTQIDFCEELLRALKQNGISTAVDTCGFVPREHLARVIPYTDVFLFDLKAFSDTVHRACTGQGNARILDNLHYLNERGCRIEVRIPYVPSHNAEEMAALSSLVRSLPAVEATRILPYHQYAETKYAALGLPCTLPERLPTEEELAAARALFPIVKL